MPVQHGIKKVVKPKTLPWDVNATPTITGAGNTVTVTYSRAVQGVGPEFTIDGGLVLESASNPSANVWIFTFSGPIAGRKFVLPGNTEYLTTPLGGTDNGASKQF